MSWEVSFRRLFYRGFISGKMFLGDVLLQYLERPQGAARLCSTTVSDLNGKFTPNKLNSKSELNKTSSHWHSSTTTSRSAFLFTSSPPHLCTLREDSPSSLRSFTASPAAGHFLFLFLLSPRTARLAFHSRHWNILKLSKCRKRGFLCVSNQQPCAQTLRHSEN